MWAAATGKARLPTVASLTGGTTRRLVPAERRALRLGTSTVEVSGPRYRGFAGDQVMVVFSVGAEGRDAGLAPGR